MASSIEYTRTAVFFFYFIWYCKYCSICDIASNWLQFLTSNVERDFLVLPRSKSTWTCSRTKTLYNFNAPISAYSTVIIYLSDIHTHTHFSTFPHRNNQFFLRSSRYSLHFQFLSIHRQSLYLCNFFLTHIHSFCFFFTFCRVFLFWFSGSLFQLLVIVFTTFYTKTKKIHKKKHWFIFGSPLRRLCRLAFQVLHISFLSLWWEVLFFVASLFVLALLYNSSMRFNHENFSYTVFEQSIQKLNRISKINNSTEV